jgi:serine/threonine protein kinase
MDEVPAPKRAAEPVRPSRKDEDKNGQGGVGEGAQHSKAKPSASDYADLEEILPVNAGRLKMYEVGKQIGTGKFSVVYRARMADGRHVALKKIHIFDMMDAKSRTKCLREVLMLQTISKHENLIGISLLAH